jgi:hypothetical protein
MNVRSRVVGWVLVGLTVAWTVGAWGAEQISGMVVALSIDRCATTPGSCQGTVSVGEPGHARTVQVKGGVTTIRKGAKQVVLQEVHLGDRVTVEVAEEDVAKVITVKASDHGSESSDHGSDRH